MEVLQAVSSVFNYQNVGMEWDHPTYPGILRGQKCTLPWDIWEESGTEPYKSQVKNSLKKTIKHTYKYWKAKSHQKNFWSGHKGRADFFHGDKSILPQPLCG